MEDINIREEYQTIIHKIARFGINHIHILGGEPFMADGLFDLLSYANSKGILITINTNGTLLSSSVIDKLIELNVSQLTISLDGSTEQENDAIRGIGNFNTVIRNIGRTVSKITENNSDMIIQVATVITKLNLKSIHKMPRVLRDLNVKYLNILKLYECGNAISNEDSLYISNEEYLMALQKLMIEAYRNGISLQIDCKPKVLELLSLRFGFKVNLDSEFSGCNAGKKILYMDNRGDIYPCGPFSHISNITDRRLRANIFNTDCNDQLTTLEESVRKRIQEFTLTEEVCKTCRFVSCCSGCAICYNGYDKLCETAMNLYSTKASLM